MSQPDRLIGIALGEVGYLEKSAEAWKKYGKDCLYPKTDYAGSDNYTKYGYELHQVSPGVMDFPAAWCDTFVDWCFWMLCNRDPEKAQEMLCGRFDDYTKNSVNLYIKAMRFFKTGQRSDQIFFSRNQLVSGVYHTGIVEKIEGGVVHTIEGNTSDAKGVIPNGGAVCRKSYLVTDPKIFGYGRPKFENTWHWLKVDGIWYYQDSDGRNSYEWKLISETTDPNNKHWYYFNSIGQMQTGLHEINGNLYYLAETGALEGALCITDDSGALAPWFV